jgi:poly(3-hydroxyalkanoate) depolymerase
MLTFGPMLMTKSLPAPFGGAAPLRIVTEDISGHMIRYATATPSAEAPFRPPLLVFNGIGAALELMAPVIEDLNRRGIAVVAFDIPGTGGSPTPTWPYRLPGMARIGRALLQHLGISKADVLGVSWGGALAQEFVHQHPAVVRRLVLAATSAGAVMVPGRASALLRLVSPRRYLDANYLARVGGDLYGGAYRTDPELLREHAGLFAPPSSRGYLYQLLAASGWTSLPWLRSIHHPALVLMGADDPIVPPINGRILAAMLPNGRLHIIDDGHLFLLSRTAEAVGMIDDFLRPHGISMRAHNTTT